MKTSTNTHQTTAFDNTFNYQDFNDSLSRIMRKYNALYIEKQHNRFATNLMNGKPDKAMKALTKAKINKVQRLLHKLTIIIVYPEQSKGYGDDLHNLF